MQIFNKHPTASDQTPTTHRDHPPLPITNPPGVPCRISYPLLESSAPPTHPRYSTRHQTTPTTLTCRGNDIHPREVKNGNHPWYPLPLSPGSRCTCCH
eukprot:749046-Hanusia_phi.AAC.1